MAKVQCDYMRALDMAQVLRLQYAPFVCCSAMAISEDESEGTGRSKSSAYASRDSGSGERNEQGGGGRQLVMRLLSAVFYTRGSDVG